MDSVLVIRGRTLKCTTLVLKCLIRTLESLKAPEGKTEDIEFIIRLLPFERTLLLELVNEFIQPESAHEAREPGSLDSLGRLLFFRWSWAHDVLRQLLTDLNPVNVQTDHKGNQAEAFDMVTTLIRRASNAEPIDKRFKRTQQVVLDNQPFIERLGHIDVEKIKIVPHPEDEEIWRLIALMFRDYFDDVSNWIGFKAVADFIEDGRRQLSGQDESPTSESGMDLSSEADLDLSGGSDFEMTEESDVLNDQSRLLPIGEDLEKAGSAETAQPGPDPLEREGGQAELEALRSEAIALEVDGLLDLANVWDIWKFGRMFRLLKRRPGNSTELQKFYASPKFKETWKEVQVAETDDEESDILRGFFPRTPYEGELLSSIMDFFEEDYLQQLTLAYRTRFRNQSLSDPDYYLEHIPFVELVDIEISQVLKDTLAELNLDLEDEEGTCYKTWALTDDTAACHILYLNEDIHARSDGGKVHFPGSRINDKIVFRCRPLERSSFCNNLRNFWPTWNDCALTENPRDGTLFLLETLPGVKARELEMKYGETAAESFFSSLLSRQSEKDQTLIVKELLGTAYNTSYKNFLRYIPLEDLSLVDLQSIGAGSYGKVYHAIWTKKPTEHPSLGETVVGDVALKLTFGETHGNADSTRKFFEELRMAHTALSGDAGGFVEFFGFTRMYTNAANELLTQPSPGASPAFLLVFEYATEGTILDYLRKHLHHGEVLQNWNKICSALNGITIGIKTIHGRNILHRDIHPNNVLVQYKYFTNSSSGQYTCVLADLGESKAIDSSADDSEISSVHTARTFGMREYQAPEIKGGKGYNPASDIYAFGQLGIDLIRLNYMMLTESPDAPAKLPLKLMHILDTCLDADPKERYEAALMGFMLEEIMDKLEDANTEWVDEYEFPAASTHESRLLSLPSTLGSRSG